MRNSLSEQCMRLFVPSISLATSVIIDSLCKCTRDDTSKQGPPLRYKRGYKRPRESDRPSEKFYNVVSSYVILADKSFTTGAPHILILIIIIIIIFVRTAVHFGAQMCSGVIIHSTSSPAFVALMGEMAKDAGHRRLQGS